MKKKITLIMALCIALCGLAGCSGSNTAESTTTIAAETTTTTAATEAETTTTTAAETKEEAPAVEGTVLYDANDIKIISTGFETADEYDESKVLGLAIENNTGKELMVREQLGSINGIMVHLYPLTISSDGYVNMGGDFTVPAENDTDRRYLHLMSENVVRERIPEISEVAVSFEIVIGDDWENVIYTDIVSVKDPDSDYVQEYDDTGDVAYDKDGIKIVLQGTDYDESFWGPSVNVCAYNGSDKTVRIRSSQCILDGEEHDAYSTMDIVPGCYYFENMLFDGVSEMPPISTVTMSFDIYEYDPWEEGTLLDSSESFMAEYEPIHIKTEEEKAAEAAEAKGWWTREGDFYNEETHTGVTISFIASDENTWSLSGHFEGETYWGGDAELTDEGLSGTMETMSISVFGENIEGDPIEVKITEDGDDGILLTLGTGEEYHLVPVAG